MSAPALQTTRSSLSRGSARRRVDLPLPKRWGTRMLRDVTTTQIAMEPISIESWSARDRIVRRNIVLDDEVTESRSYLPWPRRVTRFSRPTSTLALPTSTLALPTSDFNSSSSDFYSSFNFYNSAATKRPRAKRQS